MEPLQLPVLKVGDLVEVIFETYHFKGREFGRRGRVISTGIPDDTGWHINLGTHVSHYMHRTSLKLVARQPKVLSLCL